jgi:cytidyltransferase-like protein
MASSKPKDRERIANYFASAILMPKSMLLGEVNKYREVGSSEVQNLSQAFHVSPATMSIRLRELQGELRDLRVSTCLSEIPEPIQWKDPITTGPNWKYTIVKLDYSIVDHSLYRKLKGLRSESNKLYVLLTDRRMEDIDTLLEFDCVDGFITAKPPYENEFGPNLDLDEGIRFLSLENGQWFSHLEEESFNTSLDKAITFYPRLGRPDDQLAREQQNLLDLSHLIVSPVKLHYREAAKAFTKNEKDSGKRVVIVTGCFDLITNAHIRFLKRAKAAGDVLVVGIEDDTRVRAFKGAYRPVNTISQRVELMEAFEFVDFTFVIKGSPKFDIKSFYTNLHRTLKADILAVSEGDPHLQDRKEEIEAGGGKLLVVSRMEEGSSTSVIRRLLAETEFSDLVYVSKQRLKSYTIENQNSWRQLVLPMMI